VILAPFGPSAVGKTTVLRYVAERLPFVHVQNDALRIFLRARWTDDYERYLYENELVHRVADRFLGRGHSVIVDANFATPHPHVARADGAAARFQAEVFRVVAPESFVARKLRTMPFLPMSQGGLLPDVETCLEHFRDTSRLFDYDRLMPRALAVIDASSPLGPQLEGPLAVLRRAMGMGR
jgi:hypothetical protein